MPATLYIFVNWACGAVLAAVLLSRFRPEWPMCRRLFSARTRSIRIGLLVVLLAVSGLRFFHNTLYEPIFHRAQKGHPMFQPSSADEVLRDLAPKRPKSLDFAEYWLGSSDLAQGNNLYRDMADYIHFKTVQFSEEGKEIPMARYAEHTPPSREGFERLERLSRENGIPAFPFFTYPPTWYLLFRPFTWMDWRDAHDLWLVANLLFVGASVVLILLAVGYRPRSGEESLALATLILGFSPLIFSLQECQANSLVLLTVCAALYLFSRGKNAGAGALIALGAAIKVFPGILLLYFLLKRKFRLAAFGFASLAIIMLLSISAIGWDVHYWYFFKVAPTWASNISAFDMNQSIAGVVGRALVGGEGISPIVHRPGLARGLITLSQIVLLALVVWTCRTRARRLTDSVWLEISLVIVFYQLASTWVLIHHLQWLLIPYLLVWGIAAKDVSRPSFGLHAAIALSYLLTGVEYVYYREAFKGGAMALFASLKCFGTLVLFFALVAAVRRLRPEKES